MFGPAVGGSRPRSNSVQLHAERYPLGRSSSRHAASLLLNNFPKLPRRRSLPGTTMPRPTGHLSALRCTERASFDSAQDERVNQDERLTGSPPLYTATGHGIFRAMFG